MDNENIENLDIREEAQALRPNFHTAQVDDSFPSLTDPIERPEVQEEADPEESALNQIATSAGWEIIEAYIVDLKNELDALVREAMANEASFEEIGQKTMVKELAKDYLDRVLEKVHTAHEAIENQNG